MMHSKNVNNDINVKKEKLKDLKVSIIMPSYNKYDYVSLSLYCLNKQTFSRADYEVILVDDCSTDNTHLILEEFNPLFNFKYIRPKKNIGRSKARNLGLRYAKGDIIIFLDAEMLTEPDFIENHFRHHQNEENLVVCGAMHYRGIYTFLTSKYNQNQWSHINSFVGNDSFFKFSYKNYIQNHPGSDSLYPLITNKNIDDYSYKRLSFPNWYFTNMLNTGLRDFGSDLRNYTLPYIAFLTGNVSVHRKQLEKTGYFDESFQGYGAEDWELGYRLYKESARFILDPKCFSYHQEHPVSPSNFQEAMGNLYKFMKKHPHFDVLSLALEHKPGLTFTQIHYVVSQYNELSNLYPDDLKEFKQTLCDMLLKLVKRLKNNKPVENLHDTDIHKAKILIQQLKSVRDNQLYALADTFEELFKL
ncbi:glycosyltransferase [Bacillus sp. X1(2014)]|uniref:glycosyltransferase n=1 Tax=Bacillus sp. X1(2014) TaxID=1565991 RepID=UPI0011A67DA6|nr:glycosyltransferase [Bacillus sp. X1(2014)]